MNEHIAKKILLIGWNGADWNIINPMLDTGRMTDLEKLVNKGVIGNLSTLYTEFLSCCGLP